MSHHDDPPSTAPNTSKSLRLQAEEKFRGQKELLPGEVLGAEETKRLLQELRVHQIELEMQNEQLRESQKELAVSRERFAELYDFAPVGYCSISENGLILEANLTVAKLLGVTRNVLIKRALASFIMPEDQDIYYRHRQALFTTSAPQVCELRLLQTNNKPPILARLEATADEDKSGSPTCRVILSDITAYKQGETERKQLMSAIEQSGESILITDDKGNIQYVNKTFERETGYTREDVIGHTPRVMKSDKQDEAFYRKLWSTISGGDIFKGQMINKRKDGTFYTEFIVISPVLDETGTIVNYIANKRDITEHLQLEAQLHQSVKLEALGILAGGIAHDFNNILAAILGHSQMALDELSPSSNIYHDISQILISGNRAADLVQQILLFSRQEAESFHPVRIQDTVHEVVGMFGTALPSSITFSDSIDLDCGSVHADPTQIHQVVMNLCTNARQAIEDDYGSISITLSEVIPPSSLFYLYGVEKTSQKYACIEIRDSGCGIPQEIQSKVFDPFFTTKAQEKGTGLSLAVVDGIIRKHHGLISFESSSKTGTVFQVYLPIVDSIDSVVIPLNNFEIKGHERILLVDDELTLIELHKRSLERFGYQVTCFSDSFKALIFFQNNSTSYDMIVTDMTMPNLTGLDLIKEIHRIRPEIKSILCTGYSTSATKDTAEAFGVNAYLEKPFLPRELALTIRKVIDHG